MEEALKVALDVFHVPSRLRQARIDPLPRQMLTVLRIAAGESEAIENAMRQLERPREVIENAASFFIEQVLFSPEADSYRVLGGDPSTPSTELRRNMALLSRWVHPDLDKGGARASFAVRVSRAWENLKTPERRQIYDAKAAARRQDAERGNGRKRAGSTRPDRSGSSHNGAGSARASRTTERIKRDREARLELERLVRGGFLRRTISFLLGRS